MPRDTALAQKANRARRRTPNGDAPGTWAGERFIGQGPCPPRGQHVVYLLYDARGAIIYVGESANLAPRLARHRLDKPFVRWEAENHETRESALADEASLIEHLRPRLNKGW